MDKKKVREFKDTYLELEKNSKKILKIYSNGFRHAFLGISVNQQDEFSILYKDYSGMEVEQKKLTFKLSEMTNDLTYFRSKWEQEREERKAEVRKKRREGKKIELFFDKKGEIQTRWLNKEP